MTDRITGFTVVLDEPLRDDESAIANLLNAIGLLRGVAAVKPVVGELAPEHIAELRTRAHLATQIYAAVDGVLHQRD
jgi:hypothetical protein